MSASVVENMARYISPINPAVYPQLTILLLSIGVFFMLWFIVYEVTSNKKDIQQKDHLFKELLMSLVASLFMGFGVFFLLLWVGLYV